MSVELPVGMSPLKSCSELPDQHLIVLVLCLQSCTDTDMSSRCWPKARSIIMEELAVKVSEITTFRHESLTDLKLQD